MLSVPDHMNAFMMFETLNDRGLKASQADLLKNHLLSLSHDRIEEAQQQWAKMIGVLESMTTDDIAVTYLHHLLITKFGPTKEREVFGKIKEYANSQSLSLSFLDELSSGANDYAALFNPDHKKWNDYSSSTRKHISVINHDLRVTQILPLMFAVSRHFTIKEAEKAFRLFVYWSVRFFVVGVRGGLLDSHYSTTAKSIGNKEITKASEIEAALKTIVPSDALFETAFSEARVSQARLARYYLRALEMQHIGASDPELVPSEDEHSVNLEHMLPENPQDAWPEVDPEIAHAYYKRIGNMALLQSKKNSIIGNSPFVEKKPVFASSAFKLTSEVANYEEWNVDAIDNRQKQMAKLAVLTWPNKLQN